MEIDVTSCNNCPFMERIVYSGDSEYICGIKKDLNIWNEKEDDIFDFIPKKCSVKQGLPFKIITY